MKNFIIVILTILGLSWQSSAASVTVMADPNTGALKAPLSFFASNLVAGAGITIATNGDGRVTISSTGGGGSATNIYFYPSAYATWSLVGGSNQVSVFGLQPTNSNLTDFSKLSTNAFDTAGAASTVQIFATGASNTLKTAKLDASGGAGKNNTLTNLTVTGSLNILNLDESAPGNMTADSIASDTLFANLTTTILLGDNTRLDYGMGFQDEDGNFVITHDGIHTGNGYGLTNLNSAIATNNTAASDGQVLSRTGTNLKWISPSGSGTVTSVGLSAPSEFTVSGSPVTGSGTLSFVRGADANYLGLGATNIGFLNVTNTANIGGQAFANALILTNGFTNQALTASTLLKSDANKKVSSIANGAGVLTNDASGNLGYAPLLDASTLKASQYVATDANTNLVSTQNGSSWTNLVSHTHEGTTTNITITFTGAAPQLFTCTNGPSVGQDYFIHFAGANGSAAIRFVGSSYNNLHFDYQPTWLSGSNSVITNGLLSFTSVGGTNSAQILAAMKEKQ